MKRLFKAIGLHLLNVLETLFTWVSIGVTIGVVGFVSFYVFVAFYGFARSFG